MSREFVLLKLPRCYCGISIAMDDNDREEYAIIDGSRGLQITEFHGSEEAAWDEASATLRDGSGPHSLGTQEAL